MLNISEITQNKINSMIESETLKKEIEDTIEKEIISSIRRAIDCYDVRNIFEKKIKQEVSETVEQISFKGYANLVIKQIQDSVNAQAEKIITEDVLQYFKDLYLPNDDKNLTVKDILNKYVENAKDYIEDRSDNVYAFMYVQEAERYSWQTSKWLEIFVSLDDDFGEDEDKKTYKIQLLNVGNEENKFKITSIYENAKFGHDMTDRKKLGYLNSFERFLISAYFNNRIFEINNEDLKHYEDTVYAWD